MKAISTQSSIAGLAACGILTSLAASYGCGGSQPLSPSTNPTVAPSERLGTPPTPTTPTTITPQLINFTPQDLNNLGEMTGADSSNYEVFVAPNGTETKLTGTAGGGQNQGFAYLNNKGAVISQAANSGNVLYFATASSKPTALLGVSSNLALSGFNPSNLNDNGGIILVAAVSGTNGTTEYTIYYPSPTSKGTVIGPANFGGFAIDNTGLVVGQTTNNLENDTGNYEIGVSNPNSGKPIFPGIPFIPQSNIVMSDNGYIVVQKDATDCILLQPNGHSQVIKGMTFPLAVNAYADVVGNGTNGGVLWTPAKGTIPFQSFMAKGSPWSSIQPMFINDVGEVVGGGKYNNSNNDEYFKLKLPVGYY